MKNIAIFGSGSYGQEIACLINKINNRAKVGEELWNFIGFFDDNETIWGEKNKYGEILGGINKLNNYPDNLSIVIAIANTNVLSKIISNITNKNIEFPNIVDPDTSFLDFSTFKIGKGNIIGEGCRFSPNVSIGDYNIFVNDTVLGHDAEVGNYNVFYPATRFSGFVKAGNNNTFGVGSTVLQGFKIGSNVKLASGSFLMNNALDGYIYRGNPARKIKL